MNLNNNQRNLIKLLQMAYSAELAAAYAYLGHWKSVKDSEERKEIQKIEAEEWQHRKLVGEMLKDLGVEPNKWLEKKFSLIGRFIGLSCFCIGWLAPMYGAGKLERANIKEYEDAARYARDSGHQEFVDCLLTMAEVEWDHEKYFRDKVLSDSWGKKLPIWSKPPPKENIRTSFAEE